MKKNIFYIILLFVLFFIIFNYKVINNFINTSIGNYFYKEDNFEKAVIYHNKVSDNFKNYNLGNDFYKLGDYEKAIFYYREKGFNKDVETFHNLGNSFFKAGLLRTTIDDIIRLWRESLLNYEKSLNIEERKKTRKNYEFVKSKLEEIEEKQKKEENQQNDSSEGKQGDDSSKIDSKGGDKEDKNKEENNTIKNQRLKQYKLSNGDKMESLTDKEDKAVKKYIENLKLEQNRNRQLFNKKSSRTNKDLFDSIFDSSFDFDNSFDNGGEKDW